MCNVNLIKAKEKEIQKFLKELSDDNLEKLKKGNIEGIKDFVTKQIDSGLIEEHKDMKELIKKEFRRRNNDKKKV